MTSSFSSVVSWFVENHTRQNKHKLPLPKICHLTLDEDVISGRAVFIIGDIHGCYDELVELMQKARSLEPKLVYLFVGDLVNKGPKSVDVIRLLRSLRNDAWSVRGNHDENVLREIRSMQSDSNYKVPRRYRWISELSADDIHYLLELPYTISIPSHQALVVHAGLVPGLALESQILTDLTNMRNIIEPDSLFSFSLTASDKTDRGTCWASHWAGPDHVYFGHDARRKFQQHAHATGLDTRCVYGGHLTGIFTNGKKLKVKSKQCNIPPDED